MCQNCREDLMALLDGELGEKDRDRVRQHVEVCTECQSEIRRFEELSSITQKIKFREPRELDSYKYWCGVCRKINGHSRLQYVFFGGIALMLLGNLMLFQYHGSMLGVGLAGLAVLAGLGLLCMGYFCHCRH